MLRRCLLIVLSLLLALSALAPAALAETSLTYSNGGTRVNVEYMID